MIRKLTPKEATYLLNSAAGRDLIREALSRPNGLDDSGREALGMALNYPLFVNGSGDFGRNLLLSNPHRVGLDAILSKLFLHSELNLDEPSDGAQVIEKGFETIPASNAFEFIKRMEKRDGVIKFKVEFSGVDTFMAQFIYHVNILANVLFEEEIGGIKDSCGRLCVSKDEFRKRVTKLYAITLLPAGGIDVFDFSMLVPYELDVTSKRYANFKESTTTFYAHGPKAFNLVRKISSLDPNNRVVVVGPAKKGGGGQSSGGGTGSSQAPGGGEVIPFPGIVRHASHVEQSPAGGLYGHRHSSNAGIAANAAASQSISAMIAAGIAVPLKPVC